MNEREVALSLNGREIEWLRGWMNAKLHECENDVVRKWEGLCQKTNVEPRL